MPIDFQYQIENFELTKASSIATWLESCASKHQSSIDHLSYVFCTDEFLLEINKKHLKHDFYTDIITFDLGGESKELAGEIYISIDRVRENASEQAVTFENELYRVMAHGLLHLLGFKDKTDEEQRQMREQEDICLKQLGES